MGWFATPALAQVSITCPSNIVTPNDADQCSAVVNYTAPVGTGSGTNVTTTQIGGLPPGAVFPVGTTQNTFRVTNDEGDEDICSFYVVVEDVQDPVFDCPDDIYVNADPGTCEQVVTFDNPLASDNCGVISVNQIGGLPSGSSFPVGENFVDFQAIDANGNSAFCRVVINVSDVNDPTITCPDDITVAVTATCEAVVNYTAPVGSDLCQSSVTTQIGGLGSGASFPVGVTTETYEVTDPEGNTATCSFDIIVVDEGVPQFDSCPSDISAVASAGNCDAPVTFAAPTASDNCPGVVVTQISGLPSGSDFPAGITEMTFVATDGAGNTDTCSFEITVTENVPPVISCPSDLVVSADPNECSAVVNYPPPVGTDNCNGANTVLIAGIGSGGTFPVGTTTETYEVTDASGNTATCSFDVTVTDDEGPIFTCPGDLSQPTDPGQCTAVVNFADPAVTDNCPGGNLSQTAGPPSGSAFPVGVTTIEYTATDAAGNISVCSFDVTVTDDEPPTIVCPGDDTIAAPPGSCEAQITYAAPTISDNCSNVTWNVLNGPASGDVVSAGTHQITLEAQDDAGNTAQCSFSITVAESTIPTITCPSDITVDADPGTCGAVVNFPDATATDDCSNVTVTQTGGPSSGSTFPAGTTTIEFTATDDFGNQATCTFDILVVDDDPPQITCPGDISQSNDPDVCGATVNYPAPTTSDNCGPVTVSLLAGLPSGAVFPVGITTVTFQATDVSGNTTECSFQVTVTDDQAPEVTCPADQNIALADGICEEPVNYALPVVSDNCAVTDTVLVSGPASGEIFQTGTTTVVYQFSDAAGNATTCSFDVTLTESVPPQITCPSDIVVDVETGQCGATVTYTPPVGTDDCQVESTVLTQGLGPGAFFPVGTTTETYTVTDASGNQTSCSFTVTVNDNEAPAIDCPEDLVVAAEAGSCQSTVNFTPPTVTDNCDPGIVAVQTAGPVSGSSFPVGTTLVEFSATDPSGNTTVCSFNVIVEDMEAPQISCPADILVSAASGDCEATVTFATPAATDNCSNVSVSQTAGPASGTVFPVGTTVVEFTATDDAGNETTCSFEVTVTEDAPPTLTCPSDITVSADSGLCTAFVEFQIEASDDCGEVSLNLVAGLPSGSDFPLGTTTVTYEATDGSGNQATCSFEVEVTDDEAPFITCPENLTLFSDSGQCSAIYEFELPGVTDNCDPSVSVIQTAGPASGTALPLGTTTYSFSATDVAGNETTCSYEVTVLDNESPTIDGCPDDMLIELQPEACDTVVTFAVPSATDNCSVTLDQTAGPAPGSDLSPGTYEIEFTAEDAAGNQTLCSFNITVVDVTPPTMICPEPIETCDREVVFTPPTATDGCGIAEVVQVAGPESGTDFPIGITTVEFEATDIHGNTTTCSFDVEVLESATRPDAGADLVICDRTEITLTGNTPEFGVPLWTQITGEAIIEQPDSVQTDVTGLLEGVYVFVYTIDPQNGCDILSDTLTVTVEEGVMVDAGPDQSIMYGGQVQLEGSVSPPDGDIQWYPEQTLSCVECVSPTAQPQETTRYFLSYITPMGCHLEDSVWVRVFRELPNTITPDGDGTNDVWNIPGIDEHPDAEVYIYNRWGAEVYASKGYDEPWDGTYEGEDLPTGAYYYIIKYNRSDMEDRNGTVNIIR